MTTQQQQRDIADAAAALLKTQLAEALGPDHKVHVEVTHRSYERVVQATVRPGYNARFGSYGARLRPVAFWAGSAKNFTLDPARIIAKAREYAASEERRKQYAAEADIARRDANQRQADAEAPVRAFIAEQGIPVGYNQRVQAWAGSSTRLFSVKLDALTEAELRTILMFVNGGAK